MVTVDANVWIAAFDPADCFHAVSIATLRSLAVNNLPLNAPDIVELEVACAVSRRRRDPSAGIAAGNKITNHPALQLLAVDAALQSIARRIGTACFLRGADALYAATAEATRSTLISWDKELVERAGGMSPGDWLTANP